MVGRESAYSSKLSWRNLYWTRSVKSVELRHYTGGASISIDCFEFDRSSPEETRLFWKDKDGWRYIETTPYGLATPERDLDDYVSRCAEVYLNSATSRADYIANILDTMKGDLKVSFVHAWRCQANVRRTKCSKWP